MTRTKGKNASLGMNDFDFSIGALADLHAGFDEMPPVGSGKQLIDFSPIGEGVVVGDGAAFFHAKDVEEIAIRRDRPPGRAGIAGSDSEAFGIGGKEMTREIAIGFVERVNAVAAQFGNETILKDAVETFDPSPRLGAIGENHLNAEFGHGALEGGRFVRALPRVNAAMTGGLELRGAVQVETLREAVFLEDFGEKEEASIAVFLLAKKTAQGLAGGVVAAEEQRAGRMIVPEPMVRAAVEKEHFAFAGFAQAAFSMLAGFANGSAFALAPEPAANRLVAKGNSLLFLQGFGEMGEVVAFVRGFVQRHDVLAFRRRAGVSGQLSPVAMRDGLRAVLPNPLAQPVDLAFAPLENSGGGFYGHAARQGFLDYAEFLDFVHGQCHLVRHSRRPPFSISYHRQISLRG